ncbi:MAG TPA: F0F1 ATP synthase subunit B [Pseudomonas sp.]|uniref:F0F1 ATP synthase subunit B family protein n=1 Tax=Pseudomonas sp. TaxID=306 RepID=UPI002EDA5C5C
MLIDWFTVAAQVLNFLILMWLLKRFLYHPILAAIDAREQRIAAQLADAEAKKAEANAARDEFLNKNLAFDKERAGLLEQATGEANTQRQRLLDQARQDATDLNAKQQENLQNQARSLSSEIGRRTQDEVFAIARKTLEDLAGATLEERMVDTFIGRLRALNPEEKPALLTALKASTEPVIVRSAFDLPEAQRSALHAAINELADTARDVQFEIAPDLVSGIELSTSGQKVAWSIAQYLAQMQRSISELLAARQQPTAEPLTAEQNAGSKEGQVS